MKRFIVSVTTFCCLLVAVDILSGSVFRYLVTHAKGGDTWLINKINNEITDDIIIFGSSRAMHHYNPRILSDSLGMTCYNCARRGMGIILMYGVNKMISQRYTPKVILYEVTPGYDLTAGDNHSFLPYLRYYYDREGIDSILWDIDATERIKNISYIYRYNNKVTQLVMNNIHPKQDYLNGFKPLDKVMQYEPVEEGGCEAAFEYDDKKLEYIEKLINECQGKTELIFFASPWYKAKSDKIFDPIKAIAERHDIAFISHYTDTTFTQHREYFGDSAHMNSTGADAYTKVVANEVRKILQGKDLSSADL